MDSHTKSCFITPPKSRHRLKRIPPPIVHTLPYVTGGRQVLYERCRGINNLPDFGKYTTASGYFCPVQGMPPLALRYTYNETIGRGRSSVIIKAWDLFRKEHVAIKILRTCYHELGAQEVDLIRRINKADPFNASSTLRLKNMFSFDDHYCMVFEYLDPKPMIKYFRSVEKSQSISQIRKVTVRLVAALGFLRKENVIHADLKPENILLAKEGDPSSLKVVDFGNAVHCVHDELSLYYEDFELQTLLYRAPEVMFGCPFGTEIDMWSLGCILAEFYVGDAIFYGLTKEQVIKKMVQLLGPIPQEPFQRGKFFPDLQAITTNSAQTNATYSMKRLLGDSADFLFVNFLCGLLKYDPAERFTPIQAACHPFLASEIPCMYLSPSSVTGNSYNSSILLTAESYQYKPEISDIIKRQHLSSYQLLRSGTTVERNNTKLKRVAYVNPMKQKEVLNNTAAEFNVEENTVRQNVNLNSVSNSHSHNTLSVDDVISSHINNIEMQSDYMLQSQSESSRAEHFIPSAGTQTMDNLVHNSAQPNVMNEEYEASCSDSDESEHERQSVRYSRAAADQPIRNSSTAAVGNNESSHINNIEMQSDYMLQSQSESSRTEHFIPSAGTQTMDNPVDNSAQPNVMNEEYEASCSDSDESEHERQSVRYSRAAADQPIRNSITAAVGNNEFSNLMTNIYEEQGRVEREMTRNEGCRKIRNEIVTSRNVKTSNEKKIDIKDCNKMESCDMMKNGRESCKIKSEMYNNAGHNSAIDPYSFLDYSPSDKKRARRKLQLFSYKKKDNEKSNTSACNMDSNVRYCHVTANQSRYECKTCVKKFIDIHSLRKHKLTKRHHSKIKNLPRLSISKDTKLSAPTKKMRNKLTVGKRLKLDQSSSVESAQNVTRDVFYTNSSILTCSSSEEDDINVVLIPENSVAEESEEERFRADDDDEFFRMLK